MKDSKTDGAVQMFNAGARPGSRGVTEEEPLFSPLLVRDVKQKRGGIARQGTERPDKNEHQVYNAQRGEKARNTLIFDGLFKVSPACCGQKHQKSRWRRWHTEMTAASYICMYTREQYNKTRDSNHSIF